IYVDSVSSTINGACFVNDSVGYIAQNHKLAAKTTNGGENWFSIIHPVISSDSHCEDVFFLDENIGFIVGNDDLYNDFIYKTTDGGLTFTEKTNLHNRTLYSVHFKENKGVIVGKGIVGSLKGSFTTDLGETWNSSTFSGTSVVSTLNKVRFISNDTVLAIGESGLIFKSIDGGKNFNYVQTPFNGVGFQGISFKNKDSIYISGRSSSNYGNNNCVLLSTDMGDTWQNIIDTNVVTNKYIIKGIEIDMYNKVWLYGNRSSIFTNAAEQVSVLDNDIINNSFELKQNFPNPFNPITTINFNLSTSSKIELIIYDLLGNKVKELIDEYREAGNHKINFDASNLSSGTYFYTLKANNLLICKKMTLLK
ncbi:MAG TPA: T9SS type A sorting domain-containing protein, partial [Ignavibacteriaceae bacterium]|nr:T9SS type A sorting domain-containing protein [Ignavibacteriaceae bacterium]